MYKLLAFPIPSMGLFSGYHLRIPDNSNLFDYISLWRLACDNSRFSSLLAAGDVSRWGTSASQRQKFHTDDVNQCLHNKCGSHGVPNANLSNFTFFLVDIGKVLCSSPNELCLTIIPRTRMGYWLRGHEGERNIFLSKIQLVGQKYREKTTLVSKMPCTSHCFA